MQSNKAQHKMSKSLCPGYFIDAIKRRDCNLFWLLQPCLLFLLNFVDERECHRVSDTVAFLLLL